MSSVIFQVKCACVKGHYHIKSCPNQVNGIVSILDVILYSELVSCWPCGRQLCDDCRLNIQLLIYLNVTRQPYCDK